MAKENINNWRYIKEYKFQFMYTCTDFAFISNCSFNEEQKRSRNNILQK